jgi:hypothetical protein
MVNVPAWLPLLMLVAGFVLGYAADKHRRPHV